MIRLAILLLLIPSVASAQAIVWRPPAEDCSLATIMGPEDAVTVNWPCVEVYAAKKDWQDATMHSAAVVLKAVHDGKAK